MQVHFPDSLRLRVPRGLTAAVQIAAKQRHRTPAEWARQALLGGLEADGVQLCDAQAETSITSPLLSVKEPMPSPEEINSLAGILVADPSEQTLPAFVGRREAPVFDP